MSGIHTSIIEDAHKYTRADSPWILDENRSVYGRLIHYLSGGGMRSLGRTVEQEMAGRKHRNLVVVLACMGLMWLVFYIF